MRKSLLILIIGSALTLLGGIFFVISMSANGWDFSTLSTTVTEYNFYQSQNPEIKKLSVNFSTANIELNEYDGEKITVEYPIYKNKKGKQLSFVTIEENENLSFSEKVEMGKWLFQLNTTNCVVKINIPKGLTLDLVLDVDTGDISLCENGKEYNLSSISIETDTGDIFLKSKITVENTAKFETDTGRIETNEIIAKTVNIENDTGRINLTKQITATENFSVKSSTGKVILNGVTAQQVSIKTSTGEVIAKNGFLDAEKIDVFVTTGDISIKLAGKKDDYSCIVNSNTGDCNISSYEKGNRRVNIKTTTGDIKVLFNE